MKAMYRNTVIAASDRTVVVEGNHYFPREHVHMEFFEDSDTHTICSWKGEASYYHVKADGHVSRDAAWYYPHPKEKALHIKDRVAFWKDVKVVE